MPRSGRGSGRGAGEGAGRRNPPGVGCRDRSTARYRASGERAASGTGPYGGTCMQRKRTFQVAALSLSILLGLGTAAMLQTPAVEEKWENPVRKILAQGKPVIGATVTVASVE